MFTFAGKLHINNFSCIMANVIKIKKGLDINLKGKASDVLLNGGKSESYAIVPDYYNGILPKVVAKVGEKVKAGSVLMIDKNRPEIKFVSPVSGEVTAVNRGEKRKVLSIVVKPDAQIEYEEFGKKNVASLQGAEVKEVSPEQWWYVVVLSSNAHTISLPLHWILRVISSFRLFTPLRWLQTSILS